MSGYLQQDSSLLIISDTPMWRTAEGVFVFEPTLREVEYLTDMFDTVTWLGYGHGSEPKNIGRLTTKSNLTFIVLPRAAGGKSFFQKLKLVRFLPCMILTILRCLRMHKFVHTRGPAVPAFMAILLSFFDSNRLYWHKYAGNWKQKHGPLAYALQRLLLRKSSHVVTVNGSWKEDPPHVLSFENPCVTEVELEFAANFPKIRDPKIATICFVGALVPEKGIWNFLRALSFVRHRQKIRRVCIVGDGEDRKTLERFAQTLDLPICFLGNLEREKVKSVYREAEIIVLPSQAEGFPKVLAEASVFGCVPIVSDISSIGQYVKNGINGLLLKNTDDVTIAEAIDYLLEHNQERVAMAKEISKLAPLFLFERYVTRVSKEIFKF